MIFFKFYFTFLIIINFSLWDYYSRHLAGWKHNCPSFFWLEGKTWWWGTTFIQIVKISLTEPFALTLLHSLRKYRLHPFFSFNWSLNNTTCTIASLIILEKWVIPAHLTLPLVWLTFYQTMLPFKELSRSVISREFIYLFRLTSHVSEECLCCLPPVIFLCNLMETVWQKITQEVVV